MHQAHCCCSAFLATAVILQSARVHVQTCIKYTTITIHHTSVAPEQKCCRQAVSIAAADPAINASCHACVGVYNQSSLPATQVLAMHPQPGKSRTERNSTDFPTGKNLAHKVLTEQQSDLSKYRHTAYRQIAQLFVVGPTLQFSRPAHAIYTPYRPTHTTHTVHRSS